MRILRDLAAFAFAAVLFAGIGSALAYGGYNGLQEFVHNGSAFTQTGDLTLSGTGTELVIPDTANTAVSIRGSDADSGFYSTGTTAGITINATPIVDARANIAILNAASVRLALIDSDLTASCTTGELLVDTGTTPELCYCQTTNTLYCVSFTDLTGPND